MPASFASSPAVVDDADVADCVQSEELGMLSQAWLRLIGRRTLLSAGVLYVCKM